MYSNTDNCKKIFSRKTSNVSNEKKTNIPNTDALVYYNKLMHVLLSDNYSDITKRKFITTHPDEIP